MVSIIFLQSSNLYRQEDWDDEDVEDEFTNQLRKELNL